MACNDNKTFFTSTDHGGYTLWSCQNVCDALSYLLDYVYIRFCKKLYRQIVGIPMGTNFAPLVDDLISFLGVSCRILYFLFVVCIPDKIRNATRRTDKL